MQAKLFAVYKPYNMLCQFGAEQVGDITLAHLPYTFSKDIYPIGRLDKDSEGLLLLSNDGKLKARLLKPSASKVKIYAVQVDGAITDQAIAQLSAGVVITVKGTKYRTLPCKVYKIPVPNLPERIPPVRIRANIPTSWIAIQITEGKNRQIRKMTAAVGFPTLRLVRTVFDKYSLEELQLQPGEVRQLY